MSNFTLICGSCVIESKEMCDLIATEVNKICKKLDIEYVFKASFLKANRSKISSFSGLDFKEAMSILDYIRQKHAIEVLTDIHEVDDAMKVAPYVDWIQTPSLLMKQTMLLKAAGETGKKINIKKAQYSTPEATRFAIEKVRSTGNDKIWITERGSVYGLNNYVVDFRSIPIMKSHGVPVVLDITHSMQVPNQEEGVSGGTPEYIPMMARLGIVAGADVLFAEVHPTPKLALSDSSTSLELDKLEKLLTECVALKKIMVGFN